MHLRFSLLALVVLTTAPGCASIDTPLTRGFGKGGTVEMMIAPSTLRNIEPLKLDAASTKPTPQSSTTQPVVEVPITLARSRELALRNNLDLAVATIDPTIAGFALTEAESQFDTTFTTDFSFGVFDSPVNSQLQGSSVKAANLTPGLRVFLPTGGVFNLTVPMDRTESDNQFQNRPLSFTSDITASIRQPLLRGAGTDANALRIRIAFYDLQRSEAQTKLEVIRVLASVDRAYWRLFAAREILRVRLQERALAQAQLDRARRRLAAKAVAEVEVIRAESGLADTLEGIIIAENSVRDRQRELKRVLNSPDYPLQSSTILIPESPPAAIELKLDQNKLLAQAQQNRMELLVAELQIAQQTASIAAAKNDSLPLVNLDYTFNLNGLGDTLPDAWEMNADWDFIDHRVGIQVEIPIGNRQARSRLRSALARRIQLLSNKLQRSQQVQQEVLAAIDQLQANKNRVDAATQRVGLSRRLLDAEIRQFDLGLRTSTEVLNAQTSVASSESSLVAAVTEYQIAQVDLAFATGMTLGASRVAWQPTPTR